MENPEGFNEKIQWLKVFDQRPDYKVLADKCEAKKYTAGIIGEGHIIPTIGIFDSTDEIEWDKLPERFVLKCTHDSGGIIICKDKNALDVRNAAGMLKRCLKRNFFYLSREWCYKGIKPRIICEELMSDKEQKDSLTDYKFFCCNGVPSFLYISTGLENHATASISFFDLDGKRLPFKRSDYRDIPETFQLPQNFEEMKDIAARLAKAVNNRFVRIDLYSISGKVYFSEFTFYPNGGFIPFEPEEWNRKLGDSIDLK